MIPASTDHYTGKVIFLELITPDLSGSETFYGALFGWRFQETQIGTRRYAEASLDGHSVGGLIQRDVPIGDRRKPSWLGFISVPDVDAIKRQAVALGGKVLHAPRDIPNRGRDAVLADPKGAVFGVLHSTSGDPADELVDPGDWIWTSLLTPDPDHDAGFYQSLFDYDVFEVASNPTASQHLVLSTEKYARASVNSLPPAKQQVHAHWLNYVRVDDAVATARQITNLGGHVLVEPHLDRHGGRIAIVSDPQGATFGLFEWGPDEEATVTK
jgi:predicted enzyme related to lactoylglutathione lyase